MDAKKTKTPLTAADAPRFIALASRFATEGDLEAATAAAEAAVACDPANMDAVHAHGVMLARSKEFSRAAVCFRKVLQARPTDIAEWTNLGECHLSALRYPEAVEALRKAMELDPQSQHPAGRRARAIVARTLVRLQKEQK